MHLYGLGKLNSLEWNCRLPVCAENKHKSEVNDDASFEQHIKHNTFDFPSALVLIREICTIFNRKIDDLI